jgi:cytochrome c oxidase subunit 2
VTERRRGSPPYVRATRSHWLTGALGLAVALLAVLTACSDGGHATSSGPVTGPAEAGRALYVSLQCEDCHGPTGGGAAGPSLQHLIGSTVKLSDGSSVVADAAYVTQSIRDPKSQVVAGYSPIMPDLGVTDQQLQSLLAYLQTL